MNCPPRSYEWAGDSNLQLKAQSGSLQNRGKKVIKSMFKHISPLVWLLWYTNGAGEHSRTMKITCIDTPLTDSNFLHDCVVWPPTKVYWSLVQLTISCSLAVMNLLKRGWTKRTEKMLKILKTPLFMQSVYFKMRNEKMHIVGMWGMHLHFKFLCMKI